MAKMVNFSARLNSEGMLIVKVDPNKKGTLSSTGKSYRIAYVEDSYGGFIKLDDSGLKGYMLQFQLLRSVKATSKSEPADDDNDNEPAPRARKNNKKVTPPAPAPKKRGRPAKASVVEEEDAAPEPASKNNKARSRLGSKATATAKKKPGRK